MHTTTISTLEHNGWINRETWLGNLWLMNDEGLYDLFLRALKDCNSIAEVAEYLEQELREQLEDEIDVACLWQDLLGTAFDRIDWTEVVTKNSEEFKEEV